MASEVYRTNRASGSYDVIVIGSGIGGLGAAALLARAGKKVLVLEKHYVAGGFTHTFKRPGYEWDVGVHYIGEVHRPRSILRRIFDDISDKNLKWAPMAPVYDRVIIDGDEYLFEQGVTNFRKRMVAAFPAEEQAIDQYIRLVHESAGSAQGFFGEKAMPPWLARMLRPLKTRKFQRLSDRTTWDVISSLTKNPKLIGVLTAQWGDYGLPPKESSFAIHAMVVKHYFDGGNYPVGGSASMVETIEPVIEGCGGKILVKAGVEKVLVKQGKAIGVRLENGDEILAPLIVSDAGVPNTIGKLLDRDVAETTGLLKKLTRVKPSLGHICLYLGFKESDEALGLQKTNYWIYPDYDHDANVARYKNDPEAPLPIVYISFPSAKDPAWNDRYPGHATVEVLGFTPYEWFHQWEETQWKKRGDDYEGFKQKLSDRLLEKLYQYEPQLKGKVDHAELSTPLSTRHFCNYDRGEIYGIDHTPARFRQNWLRPHTPIKNLFLTGQDIATDGIGGALFGGVLAASAILRRNVIKDILQRTA